MYGKGVPLDDKGCAVNSVAESLGHFYKLVGEVGLFVASETVFKQAGDDRTYLFAHGAEQHEQITVVCVKNSCLSLNLGVWDGRHRRLKPYIGQGASPVRPSPLIVRGTQDHNAIRWAGGEPRPYLNRGFGEGGELLVQ